MRDDTPSRRTWTNLTIEEFPDLLSDRAPSPGGGAVAAMSLAMAASLVQMMSAYSDTAAFGDRLRAALTGCRDAAALTATSGPHAPAGAP